MIGIQGGNPTGSAPVVRHWLRELLHAEGLHRAAICNSMSTKEWLKKSPDKHCNCICLFV